MFFPLRDCPQSSELPAFSFVSFLISAFYLGPFSGAPLTTAAARLTLMRKQRNAPGRTCSWRCWSAQEQLKSSGMRGHSGTWSRKNTMWKRQQSCLYGCTRTLWNSWCSRRNKLTVKSGCILSSIYTLLNIECGQGYQLEMLCSMLFPP